MSRPCRHGANPKCYQCRADEVQQRIIITAHIIRVAVAALKVLAVLVFLAVFALGVYHLFEILSWP
jgi:hypothetical protein